jgi:hypothetical protein
MYDELMYEKLTDFMSDTVEVFRLLYNFSSNSSYKSGQWLRALLWQETGPLAAHQATLCDCSYLSIFSANGHGTKFKILAKTEKLGK